MTCPTCDTLRAELQRAREALYRAKEDMGSAICSISPWQWQPDQLLREGCARIDAALSSTPPQGRGFATSESPTASAGMRFAPGNAPQGQDSPQGPTWSGRKTCDVCGGEEGHGLVSPEK